MNNNGPCFISSYARIIIVILTLIAVTPIRAQVKRALLVGISEYNQSGNNSWKNIHGAEDVSIIVPILQRKGFRVTKLCNRYATASRIRNELKKLISSCRSGDVVYLHFSCHGQPYEDFSGDEEDGWDESIIPYDAQMFYRKGIYEGKNHIIDDELNSSFHQIRKNIGEKGYLCIVIDACHAGGSSRGEESEEEEIFIRGTGIGFSPQGKAYRPRINATGHFQLSRAKGLSHITILEACRSYQSNYEIRQNGRYYGPLSYYVFETISKYSIVPSLDWIYGIKRNMDADRRLTRQNMVYETSLK